MTDNLQLVWACRDLSLANTHIEDAVLRVLRHAGAIDTTKVVEAAYPSSVSTTGTAGPEAPPSRTDEVRTDAGATPRTFNSRTRPLT